MCVYIVIKIFKYKPFKLCTHHFTFAPSSTEINCGIRKSFTVAPSANLSLKKNVFLNLNITHSTQPNIREHKASKIAAAEIDGNFQICSSR